MCEYDAFADLLNKFSQLTPWVQTTIVLSPPLTVIAFGFALRGILRPARKNKEN